MSLRSTKKITRQSWDIIPMPNTVIDWVNILGKYQQELLLCTDRKGRIIGDDNIKIIGVDGDRYENESPLKIEN